MSPLPSNYVTSRGINVRGQNIAPSAVVKQSFVNTAALVTNGYKTAVAGPNAATNEYTPASGLNGSLVSGGRAVPDVPRNVVITVTHGSAVVAESGVIEGLDVNGDFISEAWSVTAGGTSKTFTGAKAFAAVTRVTITAAGDASTNTNIVGSGNVLGLLARVSLGGVGAAVKESVAGVIVTTGTLVAASSAAAADPRGTYLPAAAPNGATTYILWYISDDPENG